MKAIHTKFSGPTNTRGARIIVNAEGCKRRSYPYDYGSRDVHADAAAAFAAEHKWTGELVSGGMPDGSRVHVFTGK